MAETQKSFTHIVVNGAEDDIVIQAGAPAARHGDAGAPSEAAGRPESVSGRDGGSDDVRVRLRPADGPHGAAPERRMPKEGYRETTLEDLKGSSMSSMQKIIIALCVVGVAVAVAYCAFFMS